MSNLRRGDFFVPLLTVLSDAIAIECAFMLSYWIRFQSTIFDTLGFVRAGAPPVQGYTLGSIFIIVIWLMLFHSRKMYSTRRNATLADEFISVVKVVSLGMLVVMSTAFFYREFSYSRVVFGLLWANSIAFVFVGRAVINAYERSLYRRGKHRQEAIIIGNDSLASQICKKLDRHPSFGFEIIGYVAESPAPADLPLSSTPYLGTLAEAPAVIGQHRIQLAFIAVQSRDHPALFDLIARCEGVNIEFMMVPDVLEVLTSDVKVSELEGIPFLKIKSIPFTAWGRISKRAMDIVVAGGLLVLLSPLLAAVAVLIKIDSRGPVLFRQKRIGLDGKEFTMYKFRSMRSGAEESDREAGLGVAADPRRTRIGKIIRMTSLDELPQLFNVLKGDMSLVGPRPERTHFVQEFRSYVPKYLDRHRVKAGVTGWAQVNGLRGDTSIADRIRFDLYYIENWSLAFDVKILMRTLRAAIHSGENKRK
jgi:Undecaprenyl-phosphate glucose phosphotransferase